MVSEVEAKLNAIANSSNGKISFKEEALSFDDNSPAQTERLKKLGVKPFKMKVISNDRYIEKMVYSGLVFEKAGGAIETEPMLTKNNVSRLEFVVVSSIKRLIEQARPSIAFVGDLPHFSAGEFWEMQQIEMQTQPKSEDVYGRCIELLRNEGYTVNVYDSKSNTIQFNEDLLIYLQPWVVSDVMKKEFNRFLGSGKNAIVACQHYFMQARKYSGRGYAAVYWPQPQFSRINELLSPYGIELVLEVFFDQSKASIETNEQIRWGTYKRRDKRAPDAQPFIVRAVPADYDKQSAITARLSDILFIWGNRLRMIKNTFPPSLQWQPLISSSEDCWALDWKGGFLSEQILQGGEYFDKRQPLCVMIEGLFPALYKNNPASAPGKLLLAGSSKIFDNNQLDTTRYDNERFILNSVAELAYGKELAKIQASGAEESKGFGYVEPYKKLIWRALILCLVPFILLIYALRRTSKRRSKTTTYR
jgi:hypothetical protein